MILAATTCSPPPPAGSAGPRTRDRRRPAGRLAAGIGPAGKGPGTGTPAPRAPAAPAPALLQVSSLRGPPPAARGPPQEAGSQTQAGEWAEGKPRPQGSPIFDPIRDSAPPQEATGGREAPPFVCSAPRCRRPSSRARGIPSRPPAPPLGVPGAPARLRVPARGALVRSPRRQEEGRGREPPPSPGAGASRPGGRAPPVMWAGLLLAAAGVALLLPGAPARGYTGRKPSGHLGTER